MTRHAGLNKLLNTHIDLEVVLNVNPYNRFTASQNSSFDSEKPSCFIGSTVSQLELSCLVLGFILYNLINLIILK